MFSILEEMLPPDAQRTLMESGAVEHELPASIPSQTPGSLFTMIAVCSGDDVLIELRRHRDDVADEGQRQVARRPVLLRRGRDGERHRRTTGGGGHEDRPDQHQDDSSAQPSMKSMIVCATSR